MTPSLPILPENYDIAQGDVHLWLVSLDAFPAAGDTFWHLLSDAEMARAQKFRSAHDRARHVIGRGVVRLVFSELLGMRPNELSIQIEMSGRPVVRANDNGRDLRFSISHSGDRVLVALAVGRLLGIDVEEIREDFDFGAIAEHVLSPHERADLSGLTGAERTSAFFRCWSRKEAFAKAKGEGLSYPFDQFDASASRRERPALPRAGLDNDDARFWDIRDLDAGRGYAAALAVEQSGLTVRSWRLLPSHCIKWDANLRFS